MTRRLYRVIKTYGHDLGLSCAFRQWRTESHCRHLHGYALAVTLEFGANRLDDNGWVIDFGCLKAVKAWLCETFDHKLLVAADDPLLAQLQALADADAAEVVVWSEGVGVERFAGRVVEWVQRWLIAENHAPRVTLTRVTVSEHSGNKARVDL